MSIEGLKIHEVIRLLRGIKLPASTRQRVLNAEDRLRHTGGVPDSVRDDLRGVARRHMRAIRVLMAARASAVVTNQLSMAGITRDQAEAINLIALADDKKKVLDFGL